MDKKQVKKDVSLPTKKELIRAIPKSSEIKDLHEFFTDTSEQNYINPLDFLPYQVRQEIIKNHKNY